MITLLELLLSTLLPAWLWGKRHKDLGPSYSKVHSVPLMTRFCGWYYQGSGTPLLLHLASTSAESIRSISGGVDHFFLPQNSEELTRFPGWLFSAHIFLLVLCPLVFSALVWAPGSWPCRWSLAYERPRKECGKREFSIYLPSPVLLQPVSRVAVPNYSKLQLLPSIPESRVPALSRLQDLPWALYPKAGNGLLSLLHSGCLNLLYFSLTLPFPPSCYCSILI